MLKISFATGITVIVCVLMAVPVSGREVEILPVADGVLLQNELSLLLEHRHLGVRAIASLCEASSFIVPQSSAG